MEPQIQPISKGIIHIWHTSLSPWKNKVEELKAVFSDEESLRMERLVFQNRAEDYIVSRGVLRIILARYLGLTPEDVHLKTHPNGKPYLPGSKLQFNLSHSDGLFLYGLTSGTPLGVDLQRVYPIANINTIIKNYFSPEEQNLLNSVNENLLQDLFFAIWTAKEAYLKGTGEGFQHPPNSFTICHKINGLLKYELRENLNSTLNNLWNIREIHLASNYKAALAVKGEIIRIQIEPFLPLG
jgi:4'-phosphopantetheinyl transferase